MRWLVVVLSGMLLACGSNSAEDLPIDMPTPAAANPEGVAYPEDHIGRTARRGGQRGDRIENLAFRGRRAGRETGDLETLSMADYFDPEATRHQALYVFAAASWCSICTGVARTLETEGAALEAEGARILVVLVNGNEQGLGPSLGDFDAWSARHPMGLDLGLDVRATALGPYGVLGVPFNLLIDTRSMEILDASVGRPNVRPYVQSALDFVRRVPSSY